VQVAIVDNDGDTLNTVLLDINVVYDASLTGAPIITELDTTVVEDVSQIIGTAIDNDGSITASTLTATNGSVSLDASGNIVYTPNSGYIGSDTVNVSVTDNDGNTSTQDIIVEISAGSDLTEVLDASRVVSWTFDGNADDTANNGAVADDGTLQNGGTISGGILTLDGVDDYVSIANSSDINLGEHDARTIFFTFKADPTGANANQVIFEEGAGSRGLVVYLDENGKIGVGGWNKNEAGWTGDWIVDTAGPDLRDGAWHQVALVLDGGPDVNAVDGSMTGYIDGAAFGASTASQLWGHAGDVRIGSANGTLIDDQRVDDAFFKGDIAKGEIYDTVLTASQVSEVFDLSIQSGVLIDGVVIGIEYTTSSGASGVTDEDGGFEYLEGDIVTFTIGNIVLGSLDTDLMTGDTSFLQDLAGVGLTDLNDEYLENMAVLLQSLDSNNNAYDGIVITDGVKEAFSDENFDLRTLSETDLASILADNGYTAVTEDQAMQHVKDMLIENAGMVESDFDERITDIDLDDVNDSDEERDSKGPHDSDEERGSKGPHDSDEERGSKGPRDSDEERGSKGLHDSDEVMDSGSIEIGNFMYGTFEEEAFDILAVETTHISEYEADPLDLSEVILDNSVTEESLSDYLDFGKVESDEQEDELALIVDADSDHDANEESVTLYIQDSVLDENNIDDMNIDFQND